MRIDRCSGEKFRPASLTAIADSLRLIADGIDEGCGDEYVVDTLWALLLSARARAWEREARTWDISLPEADDA